MYEYKVKLYDDEGEVIEHGLIAGTNSFSGAMKYLTEYYGEDALEECSIKFLNDNENIVVYKKEVSSIADMIEVY